MLIHRACSFSLSHLTQFKKNEIQSTIQAMRSLTQDFITALYHSCTNLALYNQQFKDSFEDCQYTLNQQTQALIHPSHSPLGARWQSKCLKQAIETLSSIDNKQAEQAHVLKSGKRKARCPLFKGYPQLDSKFITIQFKSDDPTLLMKYPTHLISEKIILNKQGESINKTIKTPTKVSAFSSEQWEKEFGLVAFDMVVRLSRMRGSQIKHSESILMIPLKQHKHFHTWLSEAGGKLLPFMELHQNNVSLVFELEKEDVPIKESVINISERTCFSVGHHLTTHTHSAKAKLKKYLTGIKPEQIWGCDVGQLKLAVLTNQDALSKDSQEQALFVGQDHKQWLVKRETVRAYYQRAVNKNRYKQVSAQRENVPYAQQQRVLTAQYEQYIKEQIQALPWDKMKVLVIENLNGIKIGGSNKKSLGRRFNKRNASWLVRQVQEGLIHYAQQNGVLVVQIDPKYTSLQCPCCNTVSYSKGKVCHREGETYKMYCQGAKCVSWDADYIGAHNIRQRLFYWMKWGSMPLSKSKKETVNETSKPSTINRELASPTLS